MPLAPQELRTFFITAVCANRRRLFQVASNADLLLSVLNDNHSKGRYQLHAFVLMPDHIHLLITPAAEISIEKVMQLIKGGFSFQLKSKFDVWQPRFTLHRIEDARDYQTHVRYIHENPVRAGLCSSAEEFPYSSPYRERKINPAPDQLSWPTISPNSLNRNRDQ